MLAEAASTDQRATPADLRRIPGVGAAIARDLWGMGIRSVADLRGQDPEALYIRLCGYAGAHVDRCMLYVFRCAVYFASTERPDPERLKWWNWSDRKLAEHPGMTPSNS
jgi:pathogenicity locus Cdd1 protein